MNKSKKLIFTFLSIAMVTVVASSFMNKTYSYGASSYVTGNSEPYTLQFYDIDSGTDISCKAAQEYYGAYKWQKKKKNGKFYYFYDCKQSTEAKYNDGLPKEIADIRARDKGDSAYRVTSTASAKAAYDHMYQNHRTGIFSLEFAENEDIDWNEVEKYVLTKYGVTNYKTNYYPYSVKGEWEPIRYGLPDKHNIETGSIEIDMWRMRITGDELKVTESFVNKLLPHLKGDGSVYQKVLASYKYITSTTTYLVDDGFSNGVESNTAIYDVFIEGKSTCIGYSIAFSYLMDKLGIESYIVDQITTNNPSDESFASVHTYNVVKMDDGKFYRVDLTGGSFLTGAGNALSDSKLPVSSSGYNKSGKPTTYSFDMNKIKGYKNEATSMKTTTTKTIKQTTTKTKTTSVASTKSTTKKTSSTTKPSSTKSTTKTTTKAQIVTNTKTNVTTNNKTTTKIKTTAKTTTKSTTNKYSKQTTTLSTKTKRTNVNHTNKLQDKKENDKTFGNIILFAIAGITIIILIIYKSGSKNKRVGDDGISDILNKYR